MTQWNPFMPSSHFLFCEIVKLVKLPQSFQKVTIHYLLSPNSSSWSPSLISSSGSFFPSLFTVSFHLLTISSGSSHPLLWNSPKPDWVWCFGLGYNFFGVSRSSREEQERKKRNSAVAACWLALSRLRLKFDSCHLIGFLIFFWKINKPLQCISQSEITSHILDYTCWLLVPGHADCLRACCLVLELVPWEVYWLNWDIILQAT